MHQSSRISFAISGFQILGLLLGVAAPEALVPLKVRLEGLHVSLRNCNLLLEASSGVIAVEQLLDRNPGPLEMSRLLAPMLS